MSDADKTRILFAARSVVKTCGEALADKAESFTCEEAESIAELLEAGGNTVWAEEFRNAHAEGDTDEDDDHHGGWGWNPESARADLRSE